MTNSNSPEEKKDLSPEDRAFRAEALLDELSLLYYSVLPETYPEEVRLTKSPEEVEREIEGYRVSLCKQLTNILSKRIMKFLSWNGFATDLPMRQWLARYVNSRCRAYGTTLANPETGEPCTLILISDKYGGKFTLENRATKKRSHTTKEIESLLPFKIIPLPLPSDSYSEEGNPE